MLKISNIKIYEDLSNEELLNKIISKYKINKSDVVDFHIIKKSIDARKKDDIHYNFTVELEIKDEALYLKSLRAEKNNFSKIDGFKSSKIEKFKSSKIEKCVKSEIPSLKLSNFHSLNSTLNNSPVIIGAGPAGLFAALTFIENGISPIIIEQGKPVEDRQKDVENFMHNRILNVNSNVQFGEGGAGTFSDGKLTTGINSSFCQTVLSQFVKFGAPEQIMYLKKPHIGTDNLINIIRNIRNYIIEHGGTFYFNTKMIDFTISNNHISSVIAKKVITGESLEIETDNIILAIGHSSRDTFNLIYDKGLILEPKNFSVGVRIEHLQSMINFSQYGEACNSSKLNLPPAEYKLAYHSPSGRSCYTFCMCPGGTVMASSSEENTIVTNGMSKFARDGVNANSALLVNVTPDDFSSTSPLAGIDFQKDLEEKAFILGGSNYNAPIQKVSDFLNSSFSSVVENDKLKYKETEYDKIAYEHLKCEKDEYEKCGFGKDKYENVGYENVEYKNIIPSYLPGTTYTDLNKIFPKFVSDTLKEGIIYFDKKIKGFAHPDSILTGVETRSSSPVKILRNEKLQSNVLGIFPCGEGAGYAGGIMSAAVDGIKCAISCLKQLEKR